MRISFTCSRTLLRRIALIAAAFSLSGLVTAHATPPNDKLANAPVIPTDSFSVSGTDVGATWEAFEQSPNYVPTYGLALNATVWYTYTPSTSGRLQVDAPDGINGHKTPVLMFQGPGTPTDSTYIGGGTPESDDFVVNVIAHQQYFITVAIEEVNAHDFTITGTLTPQSTPAPTPTPTSEPSVSLLVKTAKVSRSSDAVGKVYVQLSSAAAADLTIAYETSGTAINGTDYKMLPGSVTVPVGAVKATLKIKPLAGGTGTLSLKLSVTAGDGYTVGSSAKGKLKIVD